MFDFVQERSRMTNLIFSGIPLGSALTMVSGGYLIKHWGWPSMFYVVGVGESPIFYVVLEKMIHFVLCP